MVKLENEALNILWDVGAIIKDSHIVYTSGKHGSAYINKEALYIYTDDVSRMCSNIAEQFKNYNVEAVAAPAIGGIILSQWTAHHLSRLTKRRVLSVFAEKDNTLGRFAFKRGYRKIIAEKNVLVVEDILTTGKSVKEIVRAVHDTGSYVVGVGAICNRGGVKTSDIGEVPSLFSLTNIDLDSWDEDNCPLCKQNVPINTDVGKGKEYLERTGKQ